MVKVGQHTQGAQCGKRPRTMAVIWLAVALVAAGSWVSQAATSQTNSTSLTLNIGEAIEVVSWPDASLELHGSAVPGSEVVSDALRFLVRCNGEWVVEVRSDEPNGKLRQYDPGTKSYVTDGKTSQRALEWSPSPEGPWDPVGASGSSIGTRKPPTGTSGTEVTFFLRYCPGFDDVRLSEGHLYRTVLTYTASVGY